jgi:hypothetical protein
MNKNKIRKLMAMFLLQGLHQKWTTRAIFSWREILQTPLFFNFFSERRFDLLLVFLHFLDNKSYDKAISSSKRLHKLKPMLDHCNAKFRSVYTPECDVPVDESWMLWN